MGRDDTHRPAMLSELAAQGMGVRCWCGACRRYAVVPSDELLAKLGDVSVPSLAQWLRCEQCGGRAVVQPDWPMGGYAGPPS